MKKIILNIVLAVLCLNFAAQAQNKTPNITALKIGDKVPDITIDNILNYKDVTGKPATSAKISDFKGKLLILDFWATWCSPCVAMIPKMDSLQKRFAGKVQFLPVAYQSQKEIKIFLEKLHKQHHTTYELPDVVEDEILSKMFPHTYLPHYVWIDGNGSVKAITSELEIDYANIQKVVSGEDFKFELKQDMTIAYDKSLPLLVHDNGGNGKNMIFHSILTKNTEGLSAGYNFDLYDPEKNQNIKITALNWSIIRLYKLAYGKGNSFYGNNTTLLNVKDTAQLRIKEIPGSAYEAWYKKHSYCYELIVPNELGNKSFEIMQQDLDKLFPQYEAKVETLNTMCLALIRTSNIDRLASKHNIPADSIDRFACHLYHYDLSAFLQELNLYYMQTSPVPIVDMTSYKGLVDLDINCSLSNLAALNSELVKYDLQFVYRKCPVQMLLISDRR